jgi:hypothetical protein
VLGDLHRQWAFPQLRGAADLYAARKRALAGAQSRHLVLKLGEPAAGATHRYPQFRAPLADIASGLGRDTSGSWSRSKLVHPYGERRALARFFPPVEASDHVAARLMVKQPVADAAGSATPLERLLHDARERVPELSIGRHN